MQCAVLLRLIVHLLATISRWVVHLRKLTLLLTTILTLSLLMAPVLATSEIRDSNYMQGSALKVSAVLYKDTGEIDPSYDYWSVKVTLQDIKHANDAFYGPLYAGVRVAVQNWAVEVPTNHQPQAGWTWGQTGVTFTYMGISVPLTLPAYSVSYTESTDSSWRYWDWQSSGCPITGACWWWIFKDYAEYSVGFRVPENYKPYVQVQGWTHWYQFICLPLFGCWFISQETNNLYWVVVDPPGPTPPVPATPTQIPQTPFTHHK